MFHLNVGDGGGFFAGAESVFAVLGDLETREPGGGKAGDERGQGAVAFAGKLDRVAEWFSE